ncbi:MAG: starch-binding protein, partial [Ruminococcus bromii]
VYDYGSVKEDVASSSSNRNWGYDPVNYNAPEGSYSTNPYDGNTRITEFKQMIQALHDRGISVVMDVVYNHTYSTDSCFNRTVPGYYYRMNSSSSYSNGSGCGSETASDKLMYRKYMIESVKYWAEEYHIDGFRFDLMGIHDITTMNDIRSALDGLYSDGSGKKILMYGEPWTGGSVAISDGCSQSKAGSLNSRVGMFCDSYRDAIKGSTDGSDKGFVQGNTDKAGTVANGVTGKGFSAQAPSQTIAYADAHDNLILWDKIVKSNGSSSWNSTSSSLRGQVKKVMGLLLTSQGIPFMTAGSEFCRTKQGDTNSYKSSDAINEIDWSRVKTYSDVAAYYKGLLEIRENYSPMKSSTFNTPSFQSTHGDVVAYTYSNNKSNEWGKVCVLVNASSTNDWPITLDGSGWTVVADGTTAGLKSLGTVSGNTYTVPANSACVLVQSSTFNNLKVSEKTFGTVTIKHIDDSGNVLKTSTAKYADGTTYRTYPDTTILYDYALKDTQGVTSGTVTGGKNYNVTYVYSSSGIRSGYVTVNYVDENGESIKDTVSTKYREGDSYSVPFTSIQGYQLDTDKYPANTTGTFNGTNTTINFVYKALDSTSSVVHYYNSNNWSNVRCYAYTDGGEEPNGKWNNATVMTSEGNGWLKCTIPAPSSYVMFHTNSQQEPGANETGYLVSGEAWVQNKKLSFSSKVNTSHIDAATGEKIADDEILIQSKVSSDDTYKTSPLPGRTDVIAPVNASGNLSSGIINVVYLYTSSERPSTAPSTVTPTTAPVTQPTEKILIGDVNLNGAINVLDATAVQKYIVKLITLSDKALIAAARCDAEDDIVSVKDATYIQMYVTKLDGHGNVGTYYESEVTPTTAPVTEPATEEPTVAPTTVPATTAPVTEPTTTPSSTYTVKFTDSLNWDGTLYCYSWAEDGTSTKSWPGVAMTYLNTNDYGQKVYSVEVPNTVDYIIFTNGSSQTIDIGFDGTSLNYYTESQYDSKGHAYVGTW